mmetsp:Transcript_10733/g.29832  ORF Transcript_10733/g.29832 Transcript_10733/m.29832 type:complete len:270 (-) Transcript_10733:706-1515(-)
MVRSNRPGRRRASSSADARLVAPMTSTWSSWKNPSISVSSCNSPCSRSADPESAIRSSLDLPMASISSMKMMAGAFFLAAANRDRILAAATPWNISTNSAPFAEKNGMPASPAIALASSVFPVPGGPSSNTPLIGCAPISLNRSPPSRMSSTILISSFTASIPATSSYLTPVSRFVFFFFFGSDSSSSSTLNAVARCLPSSSATSSCALFFFFPSFFRTQSPDPTNSRSASRPMMGRNWVEYVLRNTKESPGSTTCSSGRTSFSLSRLS